MTTLLGARPGSGAGSGTQHLDGGSGFPFDSLRRHGPRRRYLIVARRGPSGTGLSAPLAERAAAGPCSFHVVALSRPIALTAVLGAAGDPATGFVGFGDIAEARRHDRLHAERVFEAWHRRFAALGLDVDGDIVETGAVDAVTRTVGSRGSFNEILLAEHRSSMRNTLSRATGWDLTQRLQRRVQLPTSRVDP